MTREQLYELQDWSRGQQQGQFHPTTGTIWYNSLRSRLRKARRRGIATHRQIKMNYKRARRLKPR